MIYGRNIKILITAIVKFGASSNFSTNAHHFSIPEVTDSTNVVQFLNFPSTASIGCSSPISNHFSAFQIYYEFVIHPSHCLSSTFTLESLLHLYFFVIFSPKSLSLYYFPFSFLSLVFLASSSKSIISDIPLLRPLPFPILILL